VLGWRSAAPTRSRLAERGGAGDGGAFSLLLPDSRSYDRVDPAVCCGPLLRTRPPAASRGMGPQGAASDHGRCVGEDGPGSG
jgi:hypothetical protein